MNEPRKSIDRLIASLQERAKELNCLYRVEEILKDQHRPLDSILPEVIAAIPPGWQYPEICQARIILEGKTHQSSGFVESPWVQSADILAHDQVLGSISVYYTKEMPSEDEGPFLKEETRLINTIAERLGHRIVHQRMRQIVHELESTKAAGADKPHGEWSIVIKMLKQTDKNLYQNLSRKMLNHLCWAGVPEAEKLLESMGTDPLPDSDSDDWNRPMRRRGVELPPDLSFAPFKIASEHLSDDEIFTLIQRWIQEDKLSSLIQIVNRNLPLAEIADGIRRYHHLAVEEADVSSPSRTGIHVQLIRRLLSDQLSYIGIAKNFVEITDFYHLLKKVIFGTESHGKLGGKSAGLYLAAQILKKRSRENEMLKNVRIPKTWHLASDCLLQFMHHNNFDEIVEQRYKGINQIRLEYPHIEQTFKSARFPADIDKGLSVALDDFGDQPIIVRSSSLLEDRAGSAFSGKYKSLFLANRGTKRERLTALMDAIAEVYASTFGPEPMDYRTERGLLDFNEEMAIMIQEVVGTRVGKYFLPSFAGVAFSNNEFRWSPSIKREDGLLRLVPGLGTRAVDRLGDDYPILVAPGQPHLRVNVTPDEVVRYSPHMIDVINLETNTFETIPAADFFKEAGYELPGVKNIVSIFADGHLHKPAGLNIDFEEDTLVPTFEKLISDTPFVKQTDAILKTLETELGHPVDIEFASDGEHFYLLQCRPQSHSDQSRPSPIPRDIPKDQTIFTAAKYVSNGRIPEITHIVYVDPREYDNLTTREDLINVGRAVGKLNKLLPKRQFILMGPGRWGSRGDVKLGVRVGYSDISNTAALMEIAFNKGSYQPDLSFGTHFFQDLVESNIRYLPLFPDEEDARLNERFLRRSKNILPEVLPEYAHLTEAVRLIDVPASSDGRILRVLMNAELDRAIGYLAKPGTDSEPVDLIQSEDRRGDNYWHWRLEAARKIAARLDPDRFGVVGFYIFGSTKNATAGPGSDIDLLLHIRSTDEQREKLVHWLEGWSHSLAEINFLRTGYQSDGLLDFHLVTDKDIENKTSYASKIGAVTDAARPLKMGTEVKRSE